MGTAPRRRTRARGRRVEVKIAGRGTRGVRMAGRMQRHPKMEMLARTQIGLCRSWRCRIRPSIWEGSKSYLKTARFRYSKFFLIYWRAAIAMCIMRASAIALFLSPQSSRLFHSQVFIWWGIDAGICEKLLEAECGTAGGKQYVCVHRSWHIFFSKGAGTQNGLTRSAVAGATLHWKSVTRLAGGCCLHDCHVSVRQPGACLCHAQCQRP